ncbi:MAG: DUF1232 domain-containing protein [Gammaproteobacteria bacterium]|nr:DUF1232 domain-containing protein [Gammaproteobacteria bacterium]
MTKWTNSWAYQRANAAVKTLLSSPKKLLALVERAAQKSEKNQGKFGLVGQSLESLKVLIRMIAAYAKGDYDAVGADNLVLIIAVVVYFVMPLDALPDFIAVLGLSDDLALLTWTWGRVKTEVERFLAWELEQDREPRKLSDK